MAKNRIFSEARHIPLIADKAYKSGDPVAIGQITGVAVADAENGKDLSVHTDGAWNLTVTGTLTQGQAVYITSAGKLTATKDSNKPYGVALKAKGSGDGLVWVAPYGYVAA